MYSNNKKLGNRLFLWGLLLLQLFLIIIFMIFGPFYISQDDTEQQLQTSVKFIRHHHHPYPLQQQQQQNNNNNNNDYYKKKSKEKGEKTIDKNSLVFLPEFGNFSEQFIVIKRKNLDDLICFREGTEIINNNHSNNTIIINECKCLPEWHGQDCGQPEVLWRSFMKLKKPIKLSRREKPNKLIYIVETTGISIETLEIQIMELINIIDIYILCDIININNIYNNINNKNDYLIKNLMSSGFLKLINNKILLINDKTCAPKNILKQLKVKITDNSSKELNNKNDDIIIIYSKTDEILNKKAINYFKWYNNWPQPIIFRLKYLVYGFFWQHPDKTNFGSTVCQLKVLDKLFKSDPNRILLNNNNNKINNHDIIIVGDLNHFGGWLCHYCYQPIDIVKKLIIDTKINKLLFNYKLGIIDSNYIQNLITNGLYTDGKLELIKLNRYNDKHYSPDYVLNNSWKFDNIVINLFASWDDDYP